MATVTRKKRENLGPVIRENIIAKILFTCYSAKISYCENFSVYGISSGGNDTTIHKKAWKPRIGIYHAFIVSNSFLTLSLAEQLAELV